MFSSFFLNVTHSSKEFLTANCHVMANYTYLIELTLLLFSIALNQRALLKLMEYFFFSYLNNAIMSLEQQPSTASFEKNTLKKISSINTMIHYLPFVRRRLRHGSFLPTINFSEAKTFWPLYLSNIFQKKKCSTSSHQSHVTRSQKDTTFISFSSQ